MSLQGRRFSAKSFPSPAHSPPVFSSCSRCIVDMGSMFIVFTEGASADGPAHQRMLYRLEIPLADRDSIEFVDETKLTKSQCLEILEEQTRELDMCQIVGVSFPYFHQSELDRRKYRPCVALFGNDRPAIFLAIFMGSLRKPPKDWEIQLSAPADLAPDGAPNQIVDVSKLCGFPETYDYPGHEKDGDQTWRESRTSATPQHKYKYKSVMTSTQPDGLREKVLEALRTLVRNSPYLDDKYEDTTIEYDIGTMTERTVVDRDGDWCVVTEMYEGPPGYSSKAISRTLSPAPRSEALRSLTV